MATKKGRPPKKQYTVECTMLGVKYTQKASSIDEALDKLPFTWNQIKSKVVVKIQYGLKEYSHLFIMRDFRRIISNKLTRMLWAKRLEMLLQSTKDKDFLLTQ